MSLDLASAMKKNRNDWLYRDLDIIKKEFPDNKTNELYSLFLKKGKSVEAVASSLGVSREAVALILDAYIQEQQESEKRKIKEELAKQKAQKRAEKIASTPRIFPKNKLIIKLGKSIKDKSIKVYYADGDVKIMSLTEANLKLIKENIFGYGKHIVSTIESDYITPRQKSNLSKASTEEQRFEMLIEMVRKKRELLLEERALYMKWKFYFMNRKLIIEMRKYDDDENIQQKIRARNINFEKLNNLQYTYRNVEQDFIEATQIYNNAICSEILDCIVEEEPKARKKRKK